MEKKGGQQLFYILNPPASTKQNLLAEVFCQGSKWINTTVAYEARAEARLGNQQRTFSPAAREASSPMAAQMKAAQELTLPAQTEMLKGSF